MNWILRSCFLLILTLSGMFLPVPPAKADHFAGMEINFAYTGTPNIYLVRFRFYRDCGGIDAPNGSIDITLLTNTCAGSGEMSFPLQENIFKEVSEVCAGQATECSTPPNSGVQGVEMREFAGLVTLPSTPNGCNDWTFVYQSGNRNAGIINLNNGNSMVLSFYTSALVNNQNQIQNSSPVFSSSPIPYVCLNDTVEYNPQVTDAEGDSLVYSFAPARAMFNTLISYTTNYSFNQPFGNSTVTSFPTTLDPHTGQLTFKPTLLGGFVVVIQVQEWRRVNGVPILVGMVERDVQVQVVQCVTPPPRVTTLTLHTNGAPGLPYNFSEVKELQACVPYCIEIPAVTNATAPITLTMTSNAANEIPGSTFAITGQNSLNPVGMLCFTPTPQMAGQTIPFTVAVVDNACPIPNDIIRAMQFKVVKNTGFSTAASTDSICAGEPVQLSSQALTGMQPLTSTDYQSFFWRATDLAGNPIPGHFQNNDSSASNAVVFPSQTSRYMLSSPTIYGCTDTATVLIHVRGIQPTVQSISMLHPVQCDNITAQIQTLINPPANAPGAVWAYNWSPTTGLNNQTTASPMVSFTGQNPITYQLIVSNGSCADTGSVTVQFAPAIIAVAQPIPDPVCLGQSVELVASATGPGTNGSSFLWFSGSRIISPATATTLAYPANTGTNTYVVQVTSGQGCVVTDTLVVTVNGVLPKIEAVSPSLDILCTGQEAQFLTTVSADTAAVQPQFNYAWSPAVGLNNPSIQNPIVTAQSLTGVQTYIITASNGSCTDTDSVTIQFAPQVSVTASGSPAQICLPKTVNLSAAVIPANTSELTYNWIGSGITNAGLQETSAVINSPDSGRFIVEVSFNENCIARDTINILIEEPITPIINLNFSPDSISPPPLTVQFQNQSYPAIVIDSIVWDIQNTDFPNIPSVQLNGQNPEFAFSEAGNYEVLLTIFSVSGCKYSTSRQFTISGLIPPNIVTPNADGLNDAFEIKGLKLGAQVSVFNRWGKKVSSFGTNGSWAPSDDVPAGIYYYMIAGQAENNRRGWVELVR